MPFIKKGAQTEIGRKIEMLAEKLPYKEWYLPDPYNPASYVMPIGGLAKAVSRPILRLNLKENKLNPIAWIGLARRVAQEKGINFTPIEQALEGKKYDFDEVLKILGKYFDTRPD